jgi:hypothetical protein
MDDAEPDDLLTSSAMTIRLIAGWAGTALGALDLAMGVRVGRGSTDGSYLLFHVVLLLAGLLLLALGHLGTRPSRPGILAAALVTVGGLVIGALPATTVVCCLFDYAVRHGFPFTFLARDPGGWRWGGPQLVADLLFWACVGLFVLVAVAAFRPGDRGARPDDTMAQPTHAEQRATAADEPVRAADDENVGGLP